MDSNLFIFEQNDQNNKCCQLPFFPMKDKANLLEQRATGRKCISALAAAERIPHADGAPGFMAHLQNGYLAFPLSLSAYLHFCDINGF